MNDKEKIATLEAENEKLERCIKNQGYSNDMADSTSILFLRNSLA